MFFIYILNYKSDNIDQWSSTEFVYLKKNMFSRILKRHFRKVAFSRLLKASKVADVENASIILFFLLFYTIV